MGRAPGSLLVVSHASVAGRPPSARSGQPLAMRTHARIATLSDGFAMVEPDLVDAASWRPDEFAETEEPVDRASGYGGVGRTS